MKNRDDSLCWIPLWVDKWIFGSTRIELQPDERSVWVDLMALAAKDNGYIRANPVTPYPSIQLAGLLNISEELLKRSIRRFLETDKIEENEVKEIYYLKNWEQFALTDDYKRRIIRGGRYYWLPNSEKSGSVSVKAGTKEKNRIEENNSSVLDVSSNINAESMDTPHCAKSKKPTLPEVKKFIDHYYEEFKTRFSQCPIIQGAKDGANVKKLLNKIPFDQLIILLERFFESDDRFIMDSGYTLGVFYSQIQKLMIGKRTARGKSFEAGDLWEKIKGEEDERKRSARLQIADGPGKSHPAEPGKPDA